MHTAAFFTVKSRLLCKYIRFFRQIQIQITAKPAIILTDGGFLCTFYRQFAQHSSTKLSLYHVKAVFRVKTVDNIIPKCYNSKQLVYKHEFLTTEFEKMNANFTTIGILALLSIILARLIMRSDSAKSYVLQCQAF